MIANETVLARIEPVAPAFPDPRSETQARAAIRASESALELSRAEVQEARAEYEFAQTEYRRARELIKAGTIAARDAEAAERAWRTTAAALATAEAALQVASPACAYSFDVMTLTASRSRSRWLPTPGNRKEHRGSRRTLCIRARPFTAPCRFDFKLV